MNGTVYLINYELKTHQKIGEIDNLDYDNYRVLLKPYCDKYINEMKIGYMIFFATEEDRLLSAEFRVSFADWIEDETEDLYYYDVAESEEQVMFSRIVNHKSIQKKYSMEIQKINNKLSDLEQGRIYELTGSKMDGYLNTNIAKLRDDLNDLLNKIENVSDSIKDELGAVIYGSDLHNKQ